MDEVFKSFQTILIWAIPVLFAVTVHEAAHGFIANKLGDRTALLMGRITLNPIKHIDLVGTILVPMIFVLLGGFIFGWAKPVPVNWHNLKNPKRDMALVALAGPGANLLMALLWAGITKIFIELSEMGFANGKVIIYMGIAGISVNLMLMLLNLIPIPPLDGSRVVSSMLSRDLANKYDELERYGFIILIILIFSGALSTILQPPYNFLRNSLVTLFGM